MKEYLKPKMEITEFDIEDIIVTSGDSSQVDDYKDNSTTDDTIFD